jgi:hypothetical protein
MARALTISARPPLLAKGTASAVTIRIFIPIIVAEAKKKVKRVQVPLVFHAPPPKKAKKPPKPLDIFSKPWYTLSVVLFSNPFKEALL